MVRYIVDFGCGSGDSLKMLAEWGSENNFKLKLTGIDNSPETINYAKNYCRDFENINFICADFFSNEVNDLNFDVAFNCLVSHHLNDKELKKFLKMMYKNSKLGFFINDLHRHPLAYHSIDVLTKLFSKSYLVKNDARLSVWRSFRKNEWDNYLKDAGIQNYIIHWELAFRYLVVVKK